MPTGSSAKNSNLQTRHISCKPKCHAQAAQARWLPVIKLVSSCCVEIKTRPPVQELPGLMRTRDQRFRRIVPGNEAVAFPLAKQQPSSPTDGLLQADQKENICIEAEAAVDEPPNAALIHAPKQQCKNLSESEVLLQICFRSPASYSRKHCYGQEAREDCISHDVPAVK